MACVEEQVYETTKVDFTYVSDDHPIPSPAETKGLFGKLILGSIVEIKTVLERRAVTAAIMKALDAA